MDSVHLYDRSRVTTDWKCPRSRWWQYEFGGKGIVSGNTGLELFMGSTIHDGLAGIALQHSTTGTVDIDKIATLAHDQMVQSLQAQTAGEVEDINFANEQAALVEGLLRGFCKFVWPRLIAIYPKIVLIEQEMKYEHDGMIFMSRPDLVLEDQNGDLWYVEYKSTSSKKDDWVNSWGTAVQLHSSIKAIEATLGRQVTGVIVQGLYKGFVSYGKQSSPFCYVYKRNGNPPFSKDEISYDYKPGFKKFPVWEMDGGVKKWVAEMPDHVLQEQFPQCPPIFVKQDLVDNFFKQMNFREHEIILTKQMIEAMPDAEQDLLSVAFPQHFDQCIPSFGRPCQYRKLCHGPQVDPLQAGYVWREPHHTAEVEQQSDAAE